MKKQKKTFKAYRCDFYREIKKTYNKFLSLMFIVALGVAFYSGVRSTSPDMELSADKLFDQSHFMDLKVQSQTGISKELVEQIEKTEGVWLAEGSYTMDVIDETLEDTGVVRLMSYSGNINIPNIQEGRAPRTETECIVDKMYLERQGYQLGDVIQIKSGAGDGAPLAIKRTEYTVVGAFTSPFYLQKEKGSSSIGNGKVSGVVYLMPDNFMLPVYTEAYVTVEGAGELVCFTEEYEDTVEEISQNIQELQEEIYVTGRNQHHQYVEYKLDSERIGKIGDIVPIIFFGVAALVSLTTMIRMVEEQRTQIGTLKALGYGSVTISMKYIMYGLLATVLGSVIGGVTGGKLLPMVIINAYKIIYPDLTELVTPLHLSHVLLAFGMAMVSVIGATLAACVQTLRLSAAELMRPAAPKQGKRILLEHLPLIWNHMSFIWKSTVRNMMRYKKKMLMTIFGICGCMGLLLIGFGIKNSITSIVDRQYGDLHVYNEVLIYENGMDIAQKEMTKKKVQEHEKVKSVLEIHQGAATFSANDEKADGYIYVPQQDEKMPEFINLRNQETREQITLHDGTVVITKKLSQLLDIQKGDKIEMKLISGETVDVEVGDITENYVFHFVYMNQNTYQQLFDSEAEYSEILVNLKDAYIDQEVGEEFLSIDGVSSISSIDTLRGTFSDMLKGLDIIIVVIIGAAGGLAFVVLYNLNTINIGERTRELATLKVLGFYDGEVSSYVFRENMLLTIVGIVFGCGFGTILHRLVIHIVEPDFILFGKDIYTASYFYASCMTLLFALLINFAMHYKLKKINMSTSLKSVE